MRFIIAKFIAFKRTFLFLFFTVMVLFFWEKLATLVLNALNYFLLDLEVVKIVLGGSPISDENIIKMASDPIFIKLFILAVLFFYLRPYGERFLNLILNKFIGWLHKPDSGNDLPIQSAKDDRLNRGPLVNKIYDSLNILRSGTYSILLDAKWGDGKTSIANMLKDKCSKKNEFIFMDFNAWAYSTEKGVYSSFFEQLKKTCPFIRTSADSLYLILAKKQWHWVTLIVSPPTLEGLKNKIFNALVLRDKKLVIIIDDLDRLSAVEIIDVFKIIGEFSPQCNRVTNVIFLMLCDFNIIQQRVEDFYNSKDEELDRFFVEKIADWNIPVITEKKDVKSFMQKYLEGLDTDIRLKPDIKFIISGGDEYEFNNLRRVKRLLNNFKESYLLFKDEVNHQNLWNLTIVKTFYPELYLLIRRHKKLLTGNPIEDKDGVSALEIKINEILVGVSESNEVKSILYHELFPNYANALEGRSVQDDLRYMYGNKLLRNYQCFDRYFVDEISENEVPIKDLLKKIKSWGNVSLEEKNALFAPLNEQVVFGGGTIYEEFVVNIVHLPVAVDDFVREVFTDLLQIDSGKNNYRECEQIIFAAKESERRAGENLDYSIYKELVETCEDLNFVIDFIYAYRDGRSVMEAGYESVFDDLKVRAKKRIFDDVFGYYKIFNGKPWNCVERLRYVFNSDEISHFFTKLSNEDIKVLPELLRSHNNGVLINKSTIKQRDWEAFCGHLNEKIIFNAVETLLAENRVNKSDKKTLDSFVSIYKKFKDE